MRMLLGVVALAFAADGALAQEAVDRRLVDAGFKLRSVDTPKQMARAERLPQRQIVSRSKNGQRYYLYADTRLCKCVLVGDQAALQAYRDMALPPVPLPGDTVPRGVDPTSLVQRDMDADLLDFEPDDILDVPF